jgi:hypothetical protein
MAGSGCKLININYNKDVPTRERNPMSVLTLSAEIAERWLDVKLSKAKVKIKDSFEDRTEIEGAYTEEIDFYFWKDGIVREAMLRRNGPVISESTTIELLVRDKNRFYATSRFTIEEFINFADEG